MLLIAAAVPLVAADWAGSAACRTCHVPAGEKHAASGHAKALRLAAEHPLAPQFRTGERPLFRDGVLIAFSGDSIEAYDAENQLEMPLEWAFGSGKRQVGFVNRINPEWHFEAAYELFPGAKRFHLGPGLTRVLTSSVKEAAGTLLDRKETLRCFGCHSTGPVSFAENGAVDVREAGVQCEACHGPGGAHAARRGKMGPAKKTVEAVCARCHEQQARLTPAELWEVRNQPTLLHQSRCFVKSKGKLGCVTCHDPHSGGSVVAAGYNGQCANCHKKLSAGHGGDCVQCHMPKVSPQLGFQYANHRIGVYPEGSRLVPVTFEKRRKK